MAPRRPSNRSLLSPMFTIICLFFIFSSVAHAASAVLGVDLGTEYIKATLVKPGIPLEIILTKDSRRKEMSAVAFKPPKQPQASSFPERAYGSDAIALAARFPGDVYPNLKMLLGLGADNSVVKEYAERHPALRLETEKIRGTAAFRSGAFVADEELWMVEEILAMKLQSIQKNAEALAGKGSKVKDIVVTVPPFYTAEEKRAVQLAAELAGLRVLELISDGLAVGINYATPRTFPDINAGWNPEYHMVFDMGAGSAKATILKFQGRSVKDVGKFNKTVQEVVVLGSGWDRTLGGDALNAAIVDDMLSQFVDSKAAKAVATTIESVRGDGRAAAKLWQEAERLRQVLSANTNTQASFEGLYEDIDFRYRITRDEFEKLTELYAARVGPVVQKALDVAELTVKDLDSVVLHGGASRTPFVQKELEKVVRQGDKIRTNVNSDEAAVFGAGFRGAGLSPSFRVKEIRSSEGAAYAAGVKWTDINEKLQHQRLWRPISYMDAEKQYSFKNQKDFTMDFYQHVPSSENVSPGSAEKELVSVTTQNLTDSVAILKNKFGCKDGDINVRLSSRLGRSNGEVEVVKLTVECEVEGIEEKGSVVESVKGMFGFGKKDQVPLSEDGEEILDTPDVEKVTSSSTSSSTSTSESASSAEATNAKDAKDSEKDKKTDSKTKTTKHLEVIPLKYKTELKGRPQLSTAEFTRIRDRLVAFDNSDRARRLREEALNQLEGFTYKVREFLDKEEFISASTESERKDLQTNSEAASEWIYSGGQDASKEDLKTRLKELKDIVTPIETRKEEAASRPEQIKLLYEALNQTKAFIEGVKGQIENDTKVHSSFTASKSRAATTSESSSSSTTSTENEFADLEDEPASATISSPPEEETLPAPIYSTEDLVAPQSLYDIVSTWLTEKLAEQEKLPPTADPVILTKDLAAKAKQLQDAGVELIMKSMKQPYKSRKPTQESEKGKKSGEKSKSKSKKGKASGSKTEEAEADATIGLGKDGKVPSEEEILEQIAALKARNAKEKGKNEEKIEHAEL